jgi:hypothetical protein
MVARGVKDQPDLHVDCVVVSLFAPLRCASACGSKELAFYVSQRYD